MLLVQNQIAEEGFQKLRCGKDAFGYVVVVGAHQCIAKVPRIIGKGFVADVEVERAQIFNGEDGCCARVALAKWMNLPKV